MRHLTANVVRKLGGLVAASSVKCWMGTLDIQSASYDETIDHVRPDFSGPYIMVAWHEYLMVPFYLHGQSNAAILTSRHRDASWLSEAARHMRFETVRGSTARGGSSALLELLRRGGKMNLGITPDGPRGPRRRLAAGSVYLSSKSRIPIIAMGIGYDRPWRMSTWDRFAIPRPHSSTRVILSPPIPIPPGLDRDGVDYYRRRVETVLNRLTVEAESWAVQRSRKVGQRPAFRVPVPLINRWLQPEWGSLLHHRRCRNRVTVTPIAGARVT